jgi:hypothetical protein
MDKAGIYLVFPLEEQVLVRMDNIYVHLETTLRTICEWFFFIFFKTLILA